MTPTFLRQIVSAHRRSQDFQRVGAPSGGSRISDWGTMHEGPKARTRHGRCEAPSGWGLGRGAVAPPGMGVWGIAP